MKKRDWLIVLVPVFLSWAIDRWLKTRAETLYSAHFYGPFGLILHHNFGAILGLFSDLPSRLRVVSLATGGAFLMFLFCIIQFLLPTKSMTLRVGLSLLMSGIIGNVTDRILHGYVVDFLVVGTPAHFSPAFNFADAIQWVGYLMIVGTCIRQGRALIPASNLRKSYWINPRFQLKYCFALMICGFGLTLILGVYSYTYLAIALKETGMVWMPGGLTPHSFLEPFVDIFAMISLTFLAVLFGVGLFLSHRAAGPINAFERFVNDYIDGKQTRLKLRAGDEFKELERLAGRMAQELSPKSSRSRPG